MQEIKNYGNLNDQALKDFRRILELLVFAHNIHASQVPEFVTR